MMTQKRQEYLKAQEKLRKEKGLNPVVPAQKKPDEQGKDVKDPQVPVAKPVEKMPSQLEMQKEEIVAVETDVLYMEWTSRGAGLRLLKDKQFVHGFADKKDKNWLKKKENWLELLPDYSTQFPSFALFGEEKLSDEETVQLQNAVWKIVQKPDDKGTDAKERELVFELGPLQGIKYIKKFRFTGNKYLLTGELILQNVGASEQKRKLELAGGAGIDVETNDYNTVVGHIAYLNKHGHPLYDYFYHAKMAENKVSFTPPAKIESKGIAWTAIINGYFGHVLTLDQPDQFVSLRARGFAKDAYWLQKTNQFYLKYGKPISIETLAKTKEVLWLVATKELTIPAEKQVSLGFKMYLGSRAALATTDKSFEVLLDYGTFAPISYLLLWVMGIFYKMFHNYGVAIILLTLAVKLAMFPLTKRQQVSMQKYQQQMKKFQPEMLKIQTKYRNNKQKMQEEVMKLYKEHHINPIPVGGCLPIFLQLPILIGLYSALSYAIELRQAEFLWISDLSQPDHLFPFITSIDFFRYFNILPILMTIVWFWQMKTAPMPEDPQMKQQQKIMMWMPIIFGFSFYNIASGLVLYWFVMQLISIIEQTLIKKAMAAK
jgi:YidC/Oxa1 family membrane protein insertase